MYILVLYFINISYSKKLHTNIALVKSIYFPVLLTKKLSQSVGPKASLRSAQKYPNLTLTPHSANFQRRLFPYPLAAERRALLGHSSINRCFTLRSHSVIHLFSSFTALVWVAVPSPSQ